MFARETCKVSRACFIYLAFRVSRGLRAPTTQKCQKNGHFSLEKAFFAFFLAMVLARTINFAEEKQQKMKQYKTIRQ